MGHLPDTLLQGVIPKKDHLIRCIPPQKKFKEQVSSTEKRLGLLEERFDDMRTQAGRLRPHWKYRAASSIKGLGV
jgi:hypothetical protein